MATLVQRINDLASAIRIKINLMVPRLVPAGGAVGAVLTKNTADDFDLKWAQPVGGSGLTVESASVTINTVGYDSVTTNISEAGVTEISKINAWLVPNGDFDADDLIGYSVIARPLIDSMDITICENGPIVGTFTINYTVS